MVPMALLGTAAACSAVDREVDSEARAISIDGVFDDWDGLNPAVSDPTQEATAGELDLGSLWLANDQESIYIRLQVGRETIWQNDAVQVAGNDIRIYFDTDSDGSTGAFFEGFGADYEVRLGSKVALLHEPGGSVMLDLNQAGLRVGPSYSSTEFELRIPFEIEVDEAEMRRVIDRPRFRLMIWEASGGDRLPDEAAVTYVSSEEGVLPVVPAGLDRTDPGDIRILSHNIHYNGTEEDPDPFRRYLRALQPDVVNFQEVWLWDADKTREFVTSVLDPEGRMEWYAAKVEDCVTVSRWPIDHSAAVDGNLVSRIDLPAGISGGDLVLFNAHTPCCGHNDQRDYEHDHMAATWRDLLDSKGPFPIESNDGVLFLGDFNMVGFGRQLASLRDGDIYNNELFGPDFEPDRQMGSLRVAPLRHTHSREIYSWRNDGERYPPGRLDYIFYSSGWATLKRNFTLYTPDMPRTFLQSYGLRSDDSLVSDHLVLVADFELRCR
jgi:endonuclease/exonuclease/phosphatase family metal-dependent hydrolase